MKISALDSVDWPLVTLTRLAGWFVSDVINFRPEHVIITRADGEAIVEEEVNS